MESSTRASKPSGAALWSTFPFGSGSIRGWTTARANYFNPSTNTSAFRISDHSGPDCTRARAAAGSSLGSSAVCAVATEYEMQQDCASAGRIMVVGPAAEFGARAPIEDEGRGIVRSRQIYRWAVEPFIVARNTVYRLVQIFRDHIPTPPSRFVFSLDALIFRVRTG